MFILSHAGLFLSSSGAYSSSGATLVTRVCLVVGLTLAAGLALVTSVRLVTNCLFNHMQACSYLVAGPTLVKGV